MLVIKRKNAAMRKLTFAPSPTDTGRNEASVSVDDSNVFKAFTEGKDLGQLRYRTYGPGSEKFPVVIGLKL